MNDGAPPRGIFAALVTPFDERREIDKKALEHLIDYGIEQKVAGFALLTEAAEDIVLRPEERKELVKAVATRLRGRRPVVVSVSAPSTNEAVELARFSEGQGARAIVVAPPHIPGIGYRELYRHVDRIMRSVGLPVLLLARPGNALDSMNPEELATLAAHDGLRGVVAPHAEQHEIEEWTKRFKDRPASVLTGSALSYGAAAAVGAHGAVCGMVLVAADPSKRIQAAIALGDATTASTIEGSVAAVVEALGPVLRGEPREGVKRLATKIARRPLRDAVAEPTYPFPLLKAAFKLQGHPIGIGVRPPFEAAKSQAVERLRAAMVRGGVLS